jgi:hypothetical protein
MAVEVKTGSAFDVGVPKRMFTLPGDALWDAYPDHSRFLVTRGIGEGQASPLHAVLGWAAEQGRNRPRCR